MQLPLDVCRKFGQFAYQDEEKGIEAIAAIQEFMEEYQDISISGDDSQAKVINIERNQAGIIKVAKSVKLLPNMQINLKELINDRQKILHETIEISVEGVLTGDVGFLYFIRFAIGLRKVKLESEHARVLIALHHLSGGELNFEVLLIELQDKMRDNYHCSLSVDELDDILEDLVELRCISRGRNIIYLQEKIILNDK